MIVVDAGVVVELLVGTLAPERLGEEEIAVPHLLDSEVTNVLRGLERGGVLTTRQGEIAMAGFGGLILRRYPADWLRPRMWELRHNLTAYDATYVALTEQLGATALLTTDARVGRASGPRCRIDVVSSSSDPSGRGQ